MSDKNSGDYEVGYGKPPKHTRFRKGQSGNPKGRPMKSLNMKTILEDALTAMVPVRIGDKVEKVQAAKALVQTLLMKALKGDIKAFVEVINLSASVGLSLVNVETAKNLSNAELSAVAQIFDMPLSSVLQQLGGGAESTASADDLEGELA